MRLSKFLRSMLGSVVGANNLMQQQGIENINNYFSYNAETKSLHPNVIPLSIGKIGADSVAGQQIVDVPEFSLLSPNELKIDTLKMKFKAYMHSSEPSMNNGIIRRGMHDDDDALPDIDISLSKKMLSSAPLVDIEITISSEEPCEAVAKINDYLGDAIK